MPELSVCEKAVLIVKQSSRKRRYFIKAFVFSGMARVLTSLLILLSFVKVNQNAERQFSDLILDGNNIWALTTSGKLALFDVNTGQPLPAPAETDSIIALAKDRNGNI